MFKKLTTGEQLRIERQRNLKLQNELLIQSAKNMAETIELVATLNELQRTEQAQANAELVELMVLLRGGV